VANQLLYELLLERVVVPFVERHPRIELVLDVVNDPAREVRAGYDLAIVVGPAPDSSMGSLFLGRAKMGCYASEGYLARLGAPDSPADLARHAIATAAAPRPLRWTFSRPGRTEVISISPRLSLGSHDLVLRAVVAGIALARLPHFYVRRMTRREALRPVLVDWSCPPVAAYAIFPNRDRPSPAARAFLAQLREPLKNTPR
jgi:DNA-binding transcriptional LysR family regulator